jgi:hypothetical protein
MNTQQTPRVVKRSEMRGFLANELAETIAAEISEPLGKLEIPILGRELDTEPLEKLSKAMFQVKYTYLREDSDRQEWLEEAISEQRSLLEDCQEIVEAEDIKEKYAEEYREVIENTEADPYFGLTATEMLSASDSVLRNQVRKMKAETIENLNALRTEILSTPDSVLRNRFREKKAEIIENLNALGSIAAMTDDDEQNKAFAHYCVKEWIRSIKAGILRAALARESALETQDIQHIIEIQFLNEFRVSDLKHLAQIYGLPSVETDFDMIERYVDMFLRESRERIRREEIEAEEQRIADEDPEKEDRS